MAKVRKIRSNKGKKRGPYKKRVTKKIDPISSKKVISKTKKLNSREKRYCSCLMKVRAKGKVRSPYAICTNSVYNIQKTKRTKVVKCSKYYKFDLYNLRALQAYAKEKKIPTKTKTGNLYSRSLLLKKIQKYIKKI